MLYRQTFPAAGTLTYAEDPVTLTDIGACVKQFKNSRFLIVGRKNIGEEHDFLGTKGRYIDFSELKDFYDQADRDQAGDWAEQWTKHATKLGPGDYVEPSQPTPEAVRNSGAVYLATRQLLEKYKTDTVTMDCLGGFAAGKLPAYPCLAFMQILNDGGQGVCEAMPNDTLSMLMARILTGRPGFVSDPALDTSKNQVVYAHCVGTTRVFGSEGEVNDYRIRTLHNRDPKGACTESLMPGGYMTTSFRVSRERKQLIIHQARALGTLDSEHGCRTKLVAEVCGDIEKLFYHWDNFGWHRVTVYGDVKEPLKEFGKALGLEIIEEA
jgi:L-fucose isomerase-like protein